MTTHYRKILLLVAGLVLSACSTHGPYTGSTTYGGGDEHGVTVYKTAFSTIDQVAAEAVLHCKKFGKVAKLLSCSSILVNSCTFSCETAVAGNLPRIENPRGGGNITPPGPPNAADRNVSSGTGFFVNQEGFLVTSAHVVRGCKEITVLRVSEGRLDAAVVAEDKNADLALLKASESATDYALIRGGPEIRVGNDIVTYGFPLTGLLSSEGNFSKGSVAAMTGFGDNTSLIQISAPVQPGHSGGPLMDYSGNVVGIVVSKLSAVNVAVATGDIPQNVNFAIKRTVVEEFLKANKVRYQTRGYGKPLDPADIAESARKYTVQIVCW